LPQIYEQRGIAPAEAGFLASVPSLISMLGSIFVNREAARLNSRKPVILALLATYGVSAYLVTTSVDYFLWLVAVVYGFCSGVMLPILMLVLMDMHDIGQKHMGTAGGIFFMVGEIGGFFGPSTVGLLKDVTGSFLPGVIFISVLIEMMLLPAFILNERRSP